MAVKKISKSAINFAVIKATKAVSEPPPRKHVETLIQAVRASGNFIPIIVDALIAKLKDKKWMVACKSLLLMHVILTQEKKVYEMLSQKISQVDVSNVTDFKGPLGEPMRPVLHNYCKFMVSKLIIYFNLQIDACDVSKQDLDSRLDSNPDYPCMLFESLLLHIKCLIASAPRVHNDSNFVPKQIFVLMYKEFIKLYGTMGILTAYIINKSPHFSSKILNKFTTNFQEFCDVHDNITDIMISANDLSILTNDFAPEKPPAELVESLRETLNKRPPKKSTKDLADSTEDNARTVSANHVYPNFYRKPLPQFLSQMISDRASQLAGHYNLTPSSNMLDLDDIYERTQVVIISSDPFTKEDEIIEVDAEDDDDTKINKDNNVNEAEALAVLSCWAGTFFKEGTVILFGADSSFELTNMEEMRKKFYDEFSIEKIQNEESLAPEGKFGFIGRMDNNIQDLMQGDSTNDDQPRSSISFRKQALEKLLCGSQTEETDE